ncbi:MAG: MBL fold metallo-hydrolase [Rhodospirillaceae bacterium]|nr:MBL fold metallo-hydrolase [Rhodospirillaceae bacterium]MBT6139299.1 MBL fold metallo-hydrolase [Rhodospirillaceae bacterium]
MADINEGLTTWQQAENHNKMIDLQRKPPKPGMPGGVELSYFASSAFRITSPGGISVMIDPWRNHPSGKWDWYYYELPMTEVDIGMSTHAHFDHDALHRLKSHTLLDRLIGTYSFGDVTIHGIADKHETDSKESHYDWCQLTRDLTGIDVSPPDNPRSFDNCLFVVETGGLRFLHWGDNRHNPPDEVWDWIGEVDVALLPVDGSRHILTYERADRIVDRLGARIVVPHHYFIWDITTRTSTLLPAVDWVDTHPDPVQLDSGSTVLHADEVKSLNGKVYHFGDNVAYERPRPRWLDGIPESEDVKAED